MTGGLGAALCALALIDPRLRSLVWVGLGLGAVTFFRDRTRVFLPALAFFLAVPMATGFSFGADSLNYFAYTSSILADFDLDLANQWTRLGFELPARTVTGHIPNAMAVGCGLIWIPAVALAHLWLLVTGGPRDEMLLSSPYYAAAAATTISALWAGALLLCRAFSRRFDFTASAFAVATVVLASPILYYALVQPLMSHGLTFAFSAACFALVLRAEEQKTSAAWALCGACLGLAMACRPQAAPLALLVATGLFRVRAGWKDILAAGGAALIAFLPQLVTWKVLYGSFVTVPQGEAFLDWTGAHALDTLVSADRGLFNWHPALLPGLVGLVLCVRRLSAYAPVALLIFVFTAFLNGSVLDWNASAAFGARRFDVILPLLAYGLAGLLVAARPTLMRKPLLLPSVGLVITVLWNGSLIDLRRGRPAAALPIDELASLQVGQARRAADATLGLLGPSARDVIYRVFVGLWTYENYRPGGDFDLATLEPRFLRVGWSSVQSWDDGLLFRYLLHPQGCIVIPLDEPFDLRGFVLARSPARIQDQRVALFLNGDLLGEALLPAAWTEVPFVAPRARWRAGENEFCIRAARRRPGDEGDDLAYAAAVARIQLP